MNGDDEGQPAPTPGREEVVAALTAFVNTSNPRSAIDCLRSQAELLLSDLALQVVDENLERVAQDAEARAVFGLRRAAILAARQRGIEAGIAELYRPDPELDKAASAFLNAPDYPAMIEHLGRDPRLLSDETVEYLAMLAQRNAHQPDAQRRIGLARALVEQARAAGVDAARRSLRDSLVDEIQARTRPAVEVIGPWEDALRLTDALAEEELAAQMRINLGQAYRERGEGKDPADLDLAVSHLEAALEVFTRAGNLVHVAGINRVLGNIYYSHPRLAPDDRRKLALDHYRRALGGIAPGANPDQYLHVNFMMADCFQQAGQIDQARTHLRDGLTAVDHANLAQAIDSCGRLAALLRDSGPDVLAALGESLDRLSQRVDQLPTGTDRSALASAHFDLGSIYRELLGALRSAYLERAIAHTSAAAQIWTRSEDPDRWARTQHNLGATYYGRVAGERADNLEQAIEYYANALTVHTRANHPRSWALTQNALGMAWLERIKGNREENAEAAEQILRQALTFWDAETDPFHWAECQNGLGVAYVRLTPRLGRAALDRAIDCFEKAGGVHTREGHPQRWAQLQTNLAATYLERDEAGDAQRALALAEQSLSATDRNTESYLWAILKRNEAAAHSRIRDGRDEAHLDAAIEALELCLPILDQSIYPAEHREAQAAVGELWFRRGAWSKALSAYRSAIAAAERLFDTAYTETGRLVEADSLSPIYRNAAYCLIQMGSYSEALELHDRGKTRVLADAMRISEASFEGLAPEQRAQASAARAEVASIADEMRRHGARATRSHAELGRAMAQAREKLSQVLISAGMAAAPAIQAEQMLQLIPHGGALAVPLLTSRGGFAFVIPSGATAISEDHVVPLEMSSDQANELLVGSAERPGLMRADAERAAARSSGDGEAVRRASNRYMARLTELSRELWQMLMQPICARLETHGIGHGAPLLLMPHGALTLLPLHAAGPDPASAVLHRFDIHYAPSGAVLAQTRARAVRQPGGTRLLAVADPSGDLAHARLECSELARLFGEGRFEVLSGARASARAVLESIGPGTAPHASHLHFACHGFYASWDPLRSGLVLADGEVLDLAEVMSPRISLDAARLVTLSACESGIAEYARYPDEYVGLGSGLLMAGAPAVVGALWAIDDRPTALLMSEFYRLVLAGRSIASALCGAQRWLCALTVGEVASWVADRRAAFRHAEPEVDGVDDLLASWSKSLAMMDDAATGARPYAHPYYWAAFSALGAA